MTQEEAVADYLVRRCLPDYPPTRMDVEGFPILSERTLLLICHWQQWAEGLEVLMCESAKLPGSIRFLVLYGVPSDAVMGLVSTLAHDGIAGVEWHDEATNEKWQSMRREMEP